MYEISETFHKQYADLYDKTVRIYFTDGSVRIGLFNDEFYERLGRDIAAFFAEKSEVPAESLVEARYARFRKF